MCRSRRELSNAYLLAKFGVDTAENEPSKVCPRRPRRRRARQAHGAHDKLDRARSRLYRSQILQVNTRWKALAEIYTMHSFALFSNLNFFVKNAESFADFFNRILQNLPDFC